jgi:hypothetical protein
MGVHVWWVALSAISVVNLVAWGLGARAFRRQGPGVDPEVRQRRRWQLALSAVFVAVCAFRSVFPRADVQRICLQDSWLSSVLVGRSVATIAELCFVAQWALLLREVAGRAGARFAGTVSRLMLPLIAMAEVCSWYATLTTSYLGNAFEESLWTVTAALLVLAAVSLRRHLAPQHRPFLLTAIVAMSAYVLFMCTVDVPMYLSRWVADQSSGRHYLSLGMGLVDVSSRWIVTYAWDQWRTEIAWMSLYFSAGSWASMALVHAPALGIQRQPARARVRDEVATTTLLVGNG